VENVGHTCARHRIGSFLICSHPQIFFHGELGENFPAFGNARNAGGDNLVGWQARDFRAVEHDAPSTR